MSGLGCACGVLVNVWPLQDAVNFGRKPQLRRSSALCESVSTRNSRSQWQPPSLQRGWIIREQQGETKRSGLEVLLSLPRETHAQEDTVLTEVELDGGRFPVEEKMRLLPYAKYVKGADIQKSSFARVYYVAALRVPVKRYRYLLECLTDYLLNWPRVDNVARVVGDDVDDDLHDLLPRFVKVSKPDNYPREFPEDRLEALELRTEQKMRALIQTRERSGAKFPNRVRNKYQAYSVEIVDEDFKLEKNRNNLELLEHKWQGSTRLLLLSEEYAGGRECELPAAIQALLQAGSKCQLVRCRLTLYYEYWSLSEILRDILPSHLKTSIQIERLGHVAFLNLLDEHLIYRHFIAQVTLDKHQPAVRSVVLKRELIHRSSYAVQVEVLAGNSHLVTTVWDDGIPFRVDLGAVIWDSRLLQARHRLVESLSGYDVICDVHAGLGQLSVSAGFKVRRIFANEVSPVAFQYLAENVSANELTSRVEIFNLDALQFLWQVFNPERPLPVTHVVMTYPARVSELLSFFVGAFNRSTWELSSLPRIHIFQYMDGSDVVQTFSQEIQAGLGQRPVHLDVALVAQVTERLWLVRVSFTLTEEIGFNLSL